jgi:hypothetical protein
LDEHFLDTTPTHRQHQQPVQHPIGPILPDLSTALRTAAGFFHLIWLDRNIFRLVRWLRSWELISQHVRQGLLQLVQIVAQGTLWHFGLTRSLGYIDLLERNSDRFDFFAELTYPINYGPASW